MGDSYVKSEKKISYVDANNLCGQSMSQPLPYDEVKLHENVDLEDIINFPDDSDIG